MDYSLSQKKRTFNSEGFLRPPCGRGGGGQKFTWSYKWEFYMYRPCEFLAPQGNHEKIGIKCLFL